jgi:deoxyribonuclease-4
MQIFTKTPNQWRDPIIRDDVATEFRKSVRQNKIAFVVGHDSYLINLASPDPVVSRRSRTAFRAELDRCRQLGLSALVSHPGNYITDRVGGLRRNARACADALRQVDGMMVFFETTAGSGTALGSTFEELARLREAIPTDVRDRVAFCADTCHLYSAGYDLRNEWDAVWEEWERWIGFDLLRCLHLNDSKVPFASRRDRHELIGEGTLGAEPFRRIMRDARFKDIPKILETPKGDDDVNDRRMLRRLRAYARPRR